MSLNTYYEHLVNKMDGPYFYRRVMALVNIGHDVLPAAQAGMGYSNWRIRRGCAAVLYHLYDTESLHPLVLLTRDPKKNVRKMALLSLGRDRRTEGEKPIDAVPHLAYSALSDPAVRVRRVAVVMLGVQAPQRRVVRLLRKLLATERDPKAIRVAEWGLTLHQNLLANRS